MVFLLTFLQLFLGVLSPFCSCSTVPIFIGFVESGIPLGVTFTFFNYISYCKRNSIRLFVVNILVFKIAMYYTIAGMTIGVVAGMLIEKLNLYHLVESYVFDLHGGDVETEEITPKNAGSICRGSCRRYSKNAFWIFIVIGISFGAVIHGYAPEALLTKIRRTTKSIRCLCSGCNWYSYVL